MAAAIYREYFGIAIELASGWFAFRQHEFGSSQSAALANRREVVPLQHVSQTKQTTAARYRCSESSKPVCGHVWNVAGRAKFVFARAHMVNCSGRPPECLSKSIDRNGKVS